jgi:hypothetical protein
VRGSKNKKGILVIPNEEKSALLDLVKRVCRMRSSG